MQNEPPPPLSVLMEDKNLKAKPLRVSSSWDEIVGVFMRMQASSCKIIVWQQNNKGSKLVNIGYVENVNDAVGVAMVQLYDPEWKSALRDDATIYFKGEEESILFKIPKMAFKNDKLIIRIPNEVRLFEKRKNARLAFNPFTLTPAIKITRVAAAKKLAAQDFLFPLFDISASGAAFKIPNELSKYLYRGDSISIEAIGEIDYKPAICAKIHYIKSFHSKYGFSHKQEFRVAIIFDKPLSRSMLRRLEQHVEKE